MRRERRLRRRCRFAAGAALAALLLGSWSRAQDPASGGEANLRELQAVQELLARASVEFDGAQQGRSIVLFDEAIARLDALRQLEELPAHGREMLAQAYELRARAYYNIGLQEKAAESFRALIRFQPQYTISKQRVSPKVVDFFDALRRTLVGSLAVSSRPSGARVSLDGEFLSLTDFFPLEVLAGEYRVDVTLEGYRPETRTIRVAPRATETLQLDLTRVLAGALFVTEPAGVEVWVDGELRATTSGAPEPALVPNLTLGRHVVEYRKRCHESVSREIELAEARDYEIEPVRLEESLATLELRSEPPGGRIFLDGEAMGVTPRRLERVCSGTHRVEVKHAAGKFVQDVTLERNASLALECPIRPSLAFLGVVADGAAAERVAADAEQHMVQNLARVGSLNFVPVPRETMDKLLEAERLTRRELLPGGGDPDRVRRATEQLARALEVQGFLIASLPEERLQRSARLQLLAAGSANPDAWNVTFAEAASYQPFLSALQQQVSATRSWTGLVTVDTLLFDGPPVLRVVARSPAGVAGVQPGDVLEGVDGTPVKRTADLLAFVAGRKPGERVSLKLRGPAGERSASLTLAETPQEIPLDQPGLLYNKLMMDLRQQIDGYPGTEAAAFARLNLALCAMHFGDFAGAHEHLLLARSELPDRPGLSRGTALYYLAVALERLGYAKEAAEAYRAAAGAGEATLFDNDGPAVAPLAERRAGP